MSRRFIVVNESDGIVENVIILLTGDEPAHDGTSHIEAIGNLEHVGIGWLRNADGLFTPPPVPVLDPAAEAADIATQFAKLQARLDALQATP